MRVQPGVFVWMATLLVLYQTWMATLLVLYQTSSTRDLIATPTCNQQQTSLLASYNESMVLDPTYQTIEQTEKDPLSTINCAAGGKYPFQMHLGISRWVCADEGERKVTAVMLRVFGAHCKSPPSKERHQSLRRGLMLDVGANHGYYGLLGMKMGCESLFFDLQPTCQKMINNAIVVNNFFALGRVFPYGVSNGDGSLLVSSRGCEGRFPISAREHGTYDKGDTPVEMFPLTHFIGNDQPILMMKVDTEGNEQRVLEGAMPYFTNQLVHNVIVEVTPGHKFWEAAGIEREAVAKTLASISDCGYTIVSLHDYSVYETSADVYSFLTNVTFSPVGQSDLWITTHGVDESVLEEIKVVS